MSYDTPPPIPSQTQQTAYADALAPKHAWNENEQESKEETQFNVPYDIYLKITETLPTDNVYYWYATNMGKTFNIVWGTYSNDEVYIRGSCSLPKIAFQMAFNRYKEKNGFYLIGYGTADFISELMKELVEGKTPEEEEAELLALLNGEIPEDLLNKIEEDDKFYNLQHIDVPDEFKDVKGISKLLLKIVSSVSLKLARNSILAVGKSYHTCLPLIECPLDELIEIYGTGEYEDNDKYRTCESYYWGDKRLTESSNDIDIESALI